MDPASSASNSFGAGNSNSENKKALMLVGSFAFVLILLGSFAYYFLFVSPYSYHKETASTDSTYKPTTSPLTPTPTTNPWLVIKKAYANPFDEETQYSNPFDENKNPFNDLE